MLRKTLKIAGTAGAMLIAAPLFAQAHGGGGMGHAGGMPGGAMGGMPGGMVGGMPGGAMGGLDMGVMHSQGPTYASPVGISHANQNSVLVRTPTITSPMTVATRPSVTVRSNGTTNYSSRSQATMHSQALLHASPTAIAHANANSVLARGAVSTTTLTGIAAGQTVTNASGTLGTVSNVIYGPNNTTIRAVVVTGANGRTYTLPANSFTRVNGGLTTTYGG